MLQLSGTAWISFGVWMVIGIRGLIFLYSRKHSAFNNSKEEDDAANL